MKRFSTLLKENCIPFERNKSTKQLCSFRLGGNVDFFIMPKSIEQLKILIDLLKKANFSYFVLGNGSNVLFGDRPSVKAVISLQKMPKFLYSEGCFVHASANVNMFELHKFLKDNYLGGFEFAFGIPASVGGAIKNNAGAFGGCVCDFVDNLTIFNTKTLKIQSFTRKKLKYSYRWTNVDGIILAAKFKFKPSDFVTISTLQNDYFSKRKLSQPYDKNSAGSIFKRDGDIIPAQLIDQAGLKGLQVGGAAVSQKHAGFIVKVNDDCTSKDVINLIKIIKKIIKNRFKIDLKEEILII